MKSTSKDWIKLRELLKILNQDGFYSGADLADLLNVSRTTIHNYINYLKELGVEFYSLHGKGYKLASKISLINLAELNSKLKQNVFYFNTITSTNEFLMQSNDLNSGDICIGEYQSKGVGRLGKVWASPYGSHLYFSIFWQLSMGITQCQGLSLVVALSVVNALKSKGIDGLGVKWPNDIYLNNKKLAGILVEIKGQADSKCDVIIGIGININMPKTIGNSLDQPWNDLSNFCIDKTDLSITLQQQLVKDLDLFTQKGLEPFLIRWDCFDIYKDNYVSIINGANIKTGIYRGIDIQGSLLLEDSGKIHTIFAGVVSLRSNKSN